jgi:outer membrane protein assembly factor BamD
MQIGMAHYKRMEKPDRDRDEALEAEGAFQTFLQKYPSSPLYKDAQQRLRDVQEVLADGEFRVAEFYYTRKADRAAVARLSQLVMRYPLYSQADRANWMLATIYDRTEHADIATQFYAQIVKNYPLSPLAADAKARLVKFGTPVPQPDPDALARMQAEQQAPRAPNRLITRPMGALKSGPDVRMAARSGAPNLSPEDTAPSTDTLVPGGTGNTIVGVATAGGASANGGSGSSNVSATADAEGVAPSPVAAPAATEVVVTPPTAGSQGTQPAAASDAATQTTPAADGTAGTTTQAANTASDAPASSPSTSSSQESTSKKKKGLWRLIP